MKATHDDDAEYGLDETPALKAMLESMARNYLDREQIPWEDHFDTWEDFTDEFEVVFTDDCPRATQDLGDPWVAVNTDTAAYRADGPEALRCIVDTLSHEVEHIIKSELHGKREFMEAHDDGYARLAGMVINVLEDQYIDRTRTVRYRGLRKTHAWKLDRMMQDDDRRPPMGDLSPPEQAFEGFIQLAHTGAVKGFSDADPAVQAALSDVRAAVYNVRFTDDPEARLDLAHEVTDRLKDVVPKRPDMPDWLKDLIEAILEDLETHLDPDAVPDDENFDPADAEVDEDGEPIDPDDDDDPAGGGDDGEDGGDGGGSGSGNRRLRDLTGGREDASHIRLE